MSNIEAIHQHIREQFELARKLYERPSTAPTEIKPEVSLTDRAAPIFQRIMTTPTEHRRRDCVSYEIVVPNVDNLDELFAEALASLGFNREAAQ